MALLRFPVVGVKTANLEWFALALDDSSLAEAGLEPSIGRSEAELRAHLRLLGLSDTEVDLRIRQARQRMTTVAPGSDARH